MLHTTTYRGHRIGSDRELSEKQLQRLLDVFQRTGRPGAPSLDGRSPVAFEQVDGLGRVAVKSYTRGGLVNRAVRHHYLRAGKTRCRKEFEMLAGVSGSGVSVPDPIAFAWSGLLFYRGWLITGEIAHSVNLANLCREDEHRARLALEAVAAQIRRLVEHRVMHVDLHPGNVLVDDRQRVFLVDFDRARTVARGPERLCDRYLRRWDRAVEKHKLPTFLSRGLHSALRCAGVGHLE